MSNSRRKFLKNSAGVIIAASSISIAPFVYAKKNFTLRVLGTHVTLQEEIRKKAMQDLGIKIVFEPGGSAEVLHRAATQPNTFDIYEQWSNSIKVLWKAGSIQPLEIARIKHWEQVNALSKTGKLSPDANYGAGDAPYKLLWVQKEWQLGKYANKIY